MEKILIAIKDGFLNKVYVDFFKEENFEVLKAESGDEIRNAILENSPDIMLLDVSFAQEKDFELLKEIKNNDSIKRIPIILFSRVDTKDWKEKVIEFEVNDFVIGSYNSPINVLGKINTHLGKTKSYRIKVDNSLDAVKDLANDLGHDARAVCPKCLEPLEIVMFRDLSKGKNYFKVSFICPVCLV